MFTITEMICTNCESRGFPKTKTKGSFWIELLLWLCFFIPGLFYSIWRLTSRYKACPKCGAPNMVSFESPRGKQILNRQRREKREQSFYHPR